MRAMGFSERYMRPGGVAPVGDWRVKQCLGTVTSAVLDSVIVEAARAYLPAGRDGPSQLVLG